MYRVGACCKTVSPKRATGLGGLQKKGSRVKQEEERTTARNETSGPNKENEEKDKRDKRGHESTSGSRLKEIHSEAGDLDVVWTNNQKWPLVIYTGFFLVFYTLPLCCLSRLGHEQKMRCILCVRNQANNLLFLPAFCYFFISHHVFLSFLPKPYPGYECTGVSVSVFPSTREICQKREIKKRSPMLGPTVGMFPRLWESEYCSYHDGRTGEKKRNNAQVCSPHAHNHSLLAPYLLLSSLPVSYSIGIIAIVIGQAGMFEQPSWASRNPDGLPAVCFCPLLLFFQLLQLVLWDDMAGDSRLNDLWPRPRDKTFSQYLLHCSLHRRRPSKTLWGVLPHLLPLSVNQTDE